MSINPNQYLDYYGRPVYALKWPCSSPVKWHEGNPFAEAMRETQHPNKGRGSHAEGLEEAPGPEEAEETLANALGETKGAEGCGGKKGGRLSEVSLRDPWPPDHPLRGDCDKFLEIFKETYHEVLAEMGLAPESGDFSAVVMSNKDFKEMASRMVEKLNANPEAKELMAVLNVDFSDGHPKKGEATAATFSEASRLIFEMWLKKHQDAAQAGENETRIDFKDFYKPKNQPTRNIELFDFWQNAEPKGIRPFTKMPFAEGLIEYIATLG